MSKSILARAGIVPMVLLIAGAGRLLAGEKSESPKPNIVVFLSDDLNWHLPGFNGGLTATPNIDGIVQGGVSLTQFYVHSVCSPTRAAFLTGRYPFRNGMEQRSHGNDIAGMLPDERTLAEALKEVGYETVLLGKWHLGNWFQRQLPLQRGFDYHYGFYGALIDYYLKVRDTHYDWHRNGETIKEDGYSTEQFAKEFEKVVSKHDAAKPFFCYMAFNAIHGPESAPAELVKKYQQSLPKQEKDANGEKSRSNALRYAVLESMDTAIGKMIAALKAKGMLENTLLVFFNDNGGVRENPPWRGGKGDTYEGGVRVSCAFRWPGHVPAGQKVDGMVHVVDLYPTLLRLGGGSLEQKLPLDGMDMWPTITRGVPSPRTEIVHSLPGDETETGPMSVRQGPYKLVERELFDIDKDPYEKTNIASQHPEIVQKLQKRLTELVGERRKPEQHTSITNLTRQPLLVFGEKENANPPSWLKPYIDQLPESKKVAKRKKKGE